jgi:F-type H+-transporting ATPase subunit delta
MRLTLRGYTLAVVESAMADGVGTRLAEELGQLQVLLEAEPGLAAVLTDSAVPAPARRSVLDDLLATRVHPAALRLVQRALTDGRADQFPVNLGEVANLVRVFVDVPEELDAQEPVRGRSAVRHALAGYSAAVFEEVPNVEGIEQTEDELFRFARVVEAAPELRAALSDPGRSAVDRKVLVRTLLQGRASTATVRLACAALDVHSRDLVQLLDWLVERAAEARGWRVARVHAAREIDADERSVLDEALRALTGFPVELQVSVEPELIGGVRIEVGDLLVDATASKRLQRLEDHLLGAEGATEERRATWQT